VATDAISDGPSRSSRSWKISPWSDVIKDGVSEPGESESSTSNGSHFSGNAVCIDEWINFSLFRFDEGVDGAGHGLDGLPVRPALHPLGRPALEEAAARRQTARRRALHHVRRPSLLSDSTRFPAMNE